MPTVTQIANRALSRLGAARVGSLQDDTKNARAARDAFEAIRDEVLSDHPWNVAVRRARLYVQRAEIASITSANPPVVTTAVAHGLSEGDPVSIDAVVGTTEANGKWHARDVGSLTFELFDLASGEAVDGTAWGVHVGGTGVATLVGLYAHTYQYLLPADCLRVLEVKDARDSSWEVENSRLMTDLGPSVGQVGHIDIRYIYRNEDVETYPPLLVSALEARLAQELALEIVDSPNKSALADQAYRALISRAKRVDAQEQTPTAPEESPWVTARIVS